MEALGDESRLVHPSITSSRLVGQRLRIVSLPGERWEFNDVRVEKTLMFVLSLHCTSK